MSFIFIILQEKDGQFGPIVKRDLFTAPNLHVNASKSGKLTKELLETWFKEINFPVTGNKSVLFIDSLSTYYNNDLIKRVIPSNVKFEISIIPLHTTAFAQPLDKYGFRLWKNPVRFSDAVLLYDLDINLYQRNNN